MQLKWHAAETGEDVSTWAVGDGEEQQLTARDNLEDIILYVCVCMGGCRSRRWKQQEAEWETNRVMGEFII
jgi:hypothetical protein